LVFLAVKRVWRARRSPVLQLVLYPGSPGWVCVAVWPCRCG